MLSCCNSNTPRGDLHRHSFSTSLAQFRLTLRGKNLLKRLSMVEQTSPIRSHFHSYQTHTRRFSSQLNTSLLGFQESQACSHGVFERLLCPLDQAEGAEDKKPEWPGFLPSRGVGLGTQGTGPNPIQAGRQESRGTQEGTRPGWCPDSQKGCMYVCAEG